jgi:hypothetical protein
MVALSGTNMAKTQTRKMEMAIKKARVLTKITVNGTVYEPDQIIEGDDALLKSLAGQVDSHPDAVAYIEGNK